MPCVHVLQGPCQCLTSSAMSPCRSPPACSWSPSPRPPRSRTCRRSAPPGIVLAAALGDHAELAMEVAGGHGDAVGEANVRHVPEADATAGRDRRPPLPTDPAYLERLALREYARAGMSDHAPWLLAQIRAESAWRPDAESPVGASGLAQAMPPTWAEEAPRTDPSCAGMAATDSTCALRFQAAYMKRVARWVDDPGSFHLAAAGYNGGAGHMDSERDQGVRRGDGLRPDANGSATSSGTATRAAVGLQARRGATSPT